MRSSLTPRVDQLSGLSINVSLFVGYFIPNDVIVGWNLPDASTKGLSSKFIRLTSSQAETFRRALAQLGSIVQRAPRAFESSAAVHTTTRKLTERVRDVLWGDTLNTPKLGRQAVPRKEIVQSAMNRVEERDSEYLSVAELAVSAGISERTLRAAFQEYFGMGPVRYLKLRTLNLVRKAIQDTNSAATTVTQIATQFGVWELGRFARDYRDLFDELPSDTLRHGRKSLLEVA